MLGFSSAPAILLSRGNYGLAGFQFACNPRPPRFPASDSLSISRRLVIRCGRRNSGVRDNKRRGDGRRPYRVGEMLRREISPIIDDAFARAFASGSSSRGSQPVMVSVVDVKCSDDLRNARVSVSVLGSDEEKEEALKWLRAARKEIRFELAQCVHLKYMPELSFTESEMAQAVKTVNILNMLAKEREEKKSSLMQDGDGVEIGPASATSLSSAQGLDLDASADDAIITTEFDDDEDDGDPMIIDVTDEGEELENLSEEQLRSILFKTTEK